MDAFLMSAKCGPSPSFHRRLLLITRLFSFRRAPRTGPAEGWRWGCAVPLLVGIASVTLLAAQNADRGIRAWDLIFPLAFALPIGVVGWLAAGLAVRQVPSRSVLAGILTAVVLFGGRAARAISVLGLVPWGELAFSVLLPVGLLGLWAYWRPSMPWGIVRFLGVGGMILVLLNAAAMRPIFWEAPVRPSDSSVSNELDAIDQAGAELPDIYFILLDSYSGQRSLREIYDLEISPFLDSLRTFGFEISQASHANYTSTFLSMASMLEWDYLDALLATHSSDDQDRSAVYALLHDNATTRFLKEQGYRVKFYRSSYPPLRSSPTADIHVPPWTLAEFEVTWLSQTLIFGAIRGFCRLVSCGEEGPPFAPDAASDHEAKFRALVAPEGTHAPEFHLAHFLLPHEPFVFRADCSHRETSYWPSAITEENESRIRVMYSEQVQCTNRKILEAVRDILSRKGARPIIILQSDHGYARFPDGRPRPIDQVPADRVRERFDIFAAYLLPEGVSIDYPGITPINAMRSIFSAVFDLDLPPLADRSYWSSFERPYDFTPVEMDALWPDPADAPLPVPGQQGPGRN